MSRTFEINEGTRAQVPLLVGLFGASSSGKTYSALRLASGIQKVRGGEIVVIDTESSRALHYASYFKFKHMPFAAPFGPEDYLEAIRQAVAYGARTIVIDSASHMHEGIGGMLEQHDAAVKRMSGGDWKKAERVNFAAWIEPKKAFQRFKNDLLQLNVAIIMCFRAKNKIKPVRGGEPKELGWMPIINDELTFEMTTNILLEPGCDGVPTWKPDQQESRERVKLPRQFRAHFESKKGALDESDGETLARWAAGETIAEPAKAQQATNGSGPMFASAKAVQWDGADEWAGKPLAFATLDTLNDYEAAVRRVLENEQNEERAAKWTSHLRTIEAAIVKKEPPAAQPEIPA